MESVLIKKIDKSLQKSGFDGLIISGWDNINYLTGTMLPFAPDYPHRKVILLYTEKSSILFGTVDWTQFVKKQGWNGEVCILSENCPKFEFEAKIKSGIERIGLSQSKIGVDCCKTSEDTWQSLLSICSSGSLESCDALLRDLRMIKEEEEVQKIAKSSRFGELGIVATLNHSEGTIDAVSFSRAEAAERVRVHVAEFGGHAVGNLTALQNDDIGRYFGLNHGRLSSGGFVRYDLTTQYDGYWSSSGRTAWIGKAPAEAKKAYCDNIALKNFASDLLKPGQICGNIFREVETKASERGIPLLAAAGIGYGIGTSERENPYLIRSDDTILAENMVLALDLFTIGPKKEWIHSVDIFRITNDGNEKLSWYRDYDRLYEIVGITARHG